jgi:hypothetical protein
MATVVVAFDGTRLSEAESESDGGTWDQWGATQSPTQETDFVYQKGASSAAISDKVSASTGGIDFDSTGTNDYTSGPKAVLALVNVTTYGVIDTTVHKGTAYQIGSSGSDYYDFYIFGSKKDYPPAGGWQFLAIDPNEVAYRAATVGSPALASVDYYGWWADITGTVKAENVVHDTLSYLTYGDGLTLTRGDAGSTEGNFQDFIDYDEGTVANRWGVLRTAEGALIVTGWLNIGDSAGTNPTEFIDTAKVILWPENFVAESFNGFKVYLGNASDDFQATNCLFRGRGRGFAKDFFHTQTDVDDVNEVITGLDSTKDWQDLDYVLYSNEGGSDAIGLTSGNYYWIAWDSTNSGWAVYSSRDNAATDTSRLGLTDGSTGENHSFKKDPDNRPDLVVSGTTGVQAKFDGSTFDNFRILTLTSKASLIGCTILNSGLITAAGADLDDLTVEGSTVEVDESAINWNVATDPDTYTNGLSITKGDSAHHAIEFGTSSPTTINLRNWITSGFNASDSQNDSTFYVARTVGSVTINVFGSTGNFSYKSAGATVTVVVDPVDVEANAIDVDGNDIANARVFLKASDGSGPFPFEETVTIVNSGTTATVTHNSHGMASNDYVDIKGASHWQNNGAHQITYINTNSYSYTMPSDPGSSPTGTITSTFVALYGLTDVYGEVTTARVYSSNQNVIGWIRKTPDYKTANLFGVVNSSTGYTGTGVLVDD